MARLLSCIYKILAQLASSPPNSEQQKKMKGKKVICDFETIFQHTPLDEFLDLPDLVRAGAVCRSWRAESATPVERATKIIQRFWRKQKDANAALRRDLVSDPYAYSPNSFRWRLSPHSGGGGGVSMLSLFLDPFPARFFYNPSEGHNDDDDEMIFNFETVISNRVFATRASYRRSVSDDVSIDEAFVPLRTQRPLLRVLVCCLTADWNVDEPRTADPQRSLPFTLVYMFGPLCVSALAARPGIIKRSFRSAHEAIEHGSSFVELWPVPRPPSTVSGTHRLLAFRRLLPPDALALDPEKRHDAMLMVYNNYWQRIAEDEGGDHFELVHMTVQDSIRRPPPYGPLLRRELFREAMSDWVACKPALRLMASAPSIEAALQ